jgi:hypothetical protein
MKSKSSNPPLIDKRVFWSMAVCAAFALSVLAFRVKNYKPCTPVEISLKQGPLYVGELIQFKAININDQRSILWGFGDESKANKNGLTVNHTFSSPGRYEIFLKTENQCSAYKTIYVLEAPLVYEIPKPRFSGPLTVEVGTRAIFEDATPNAQTWEWRFGETNGVDATAQKVGYTFKSPGTKKVILIVNGQMHGDLLVLVTPQELKTSENIPRNPTSSSKRNGPDPVVIEERPKTKPIEEKVEGIDKQEIRFPNISINKLETIVSGIVEGNNAVAELSAYSCLGQDMQVNYNGKVINLKNLQIELWKIKSKNKIRNLEVNVEKDPIKNCITTMNISLKKKWL